MNVELVLIITGAIIVVCVILFSKLGFIPPARKEKLVVTYAAIAVMASGLLLSYSYWWALAVAALSFIVIFLLYKKVNSGL